MMAGLVRDDLFTVVHESDEPDGPLRRFALASTTFLAETGFHIRPVLSGVAEPEISRRRDHNFDRSRPGGRWVY
jgi:hypothetical protein